MNTGLPTPALNETFWQQRGSIFQVFGNIKKIHQDPQPPDKQPFAVKGKRETHTNPPCLGRELLLLQMDIIHVSAILAPSLSREGWGGSPPPSGGGVF